MLFLAPLCAVRSSATSLVESRGTSLLAGFGQGLAVAELTKVLL